MMNKKKSNEREEFLNKKYQYKITQENNLKLFRDKKILLNISKKRVVGNNRRGRGGHWSGGRGGYGVLSKCRKNKVIRII